VSQYRHIALANFKFKIVFKILVDRLTIIMSHIVSNELGGSLQIDT